MTYTGAHRKGHPRPTAWILGLLLAVPLVLLGIGIQPAAAANVVNVTFHVPVSVQENPCVPELINLNGDIHIVMTSTDDHNGGYHEVNQLNSNFSGVGLLTGVKYVSNENESDDFYARPPFPVIHTHTYDWLLLSQSNTPNYVLHMTMHETVNAQGVPTATVDNLNMGCQG
jgi:hypothetical protein